MLRAATPCLTRLAMPIQGEEAVPAAFTPQVTPVYPQDPLRFMPLPTRGEAAARAVITVRDNPV